MLALLEYEGQVCSGCGGWLPETAAPEAEGRYVAHPPHRCHRCDAVQRKQREYHKADVPDALRGWPVELKS
ncbi:hypothetical protein B1813_19020 [Saccharomonospora piscinae]|uniref:Uncharacterized protein n=1 Tax=Saccharomonospora piscinae TaxID=687388 RepID=A0A1V8ZYW0_SACPI|nr:hypothetical protein [Saccharomonospora piscinae]OQO89933.1 hypothetical protein B1813_19020 [Saccharomonospora piscinae]